MKRIRNPHTGSPQLSLVMPAYNEEDIVEYTIRHLLDAFTRLGYGLEIVAVDNGSWDRTGEIIQALAAENPCIVYCRVDQNEGYGNGILRGISLCKAPWVGIIPADGQVDAEDVVRLYEAVCNAKGPILGKVRRRFRMDGLRRKLVSTTYNFLVLAMYPQIRSLDINGSPKIMPRDVITQMDLSSKGWFLDPEIMIKAHYMGVRVLEFNVFARMRGTGVSHVRMETCWEFLRNLIVFRFSNGIPMWRNTLPPTERTTPSDSTASLAR